MVCKSISHALCELEFILLNLTRPRYEHSVGSVRSWVSAFNESDRQLLRSQNPMEHKDLRLSKKSGRRLLSGAKQI